jgi:hypothetical protein
VFGGMLILQVLSLLWYAIAKGVERRDEPEGADR